MQLPNRQIFVVVDVETTGLSAAFGDRICEVGILRALDDRILDTYQTLVNPQRPISPGASRVNGLRDEDVSAAHGDWNSYNEADVKDMVTGVERFVADYL